MSLLLVDWSCDASVSLNIADPYFLVENEKLTLSESASAKGRKATLGESQAQKLGLDASKNGIKLVRGTPFAGLPLEVA